MADGRLTLHVDASTDTALLTSPSLNLRQELFIGGFGYSGTNHILAFLFVKTWQFGFDNNSTESLPV